MEVAINVTGKCVYSDEQIFANIAASLERGLPEVLQSFPAREGHVAIVGSGPSVLTQLDKIRELRAAGVPIVAVRDSHDWLIENGIVPEFALSVDPLPAAAECFRNPRKDIQYFIASQAHPKMFDYLEGMNVGLWHCYMQKGQTYPKRMLISGGSTSGLRAISLFYVLGWRDFLLFGLDCCLTGNKLRLNGDSTKPNDSVTPVSVEPEGEVFYCNTAMMQQAQQFQDYYDIMPDATFQAFGRGLIKAIIEKRSRDDEQIKAARVEPIAPNGRVSFIHRGGPEMASYRYRCAMPAEWLGATVNDFTASTLVFSKVMHADLMEIGKAKARGQYVIVDFCDDHFQWPIYKEAVRLADSIICCSDVLKAKIAELGREAVVIPESYEFPLEKPHFSGQRLLWFGGAVNRDALERILPDLENYPLRIVSNHPGDIPWSHETMLKEFKRADIVVMPMREEYKTANRTVEAVRQGCFVIAEPQPSIMDIPGIYIGNIKEGLEWIKKQPLSSIDSRISSAAMYVTGKYSPSILAAMWRDAIQRPTTSDVGTSIGEADGLTSIPEMALT